MFRERSTCLLCCEQGCGWRRGVGSDACSALQTLFREVALAEVRLLPFPLLCLNPNARAPTAAVTGKRQRAHQETREQEDSSLPVSAVGAEVSAVLCYVSRRSHLARRTDQWDSENAGIS
eukprot:6455478-Amphidinium_carterae.1